MRWRRPTPCFTNPAAVRKFVDTGGQSLWRGLKNYFEDLTKNGGMPSMVDTSAFKVGENLATTPGAVVFRNELLELIQYTPTTPKVWKRPLVMTPPQINKYYALDLSPDKSMVRFLLDSGIQAVLRQLAQSRPRSIATGDSTPMSRHLTRPSTPRAK